MDKPSEPADEPKGEAKAEPSGAIAQAVMEIVDMYGEIPYNKLMKQVGGQDLTDDEEDIEDAIMELKQAGKINMQSGVVSLAE